MNAPTWIDGLRVIALVGLAYGAWQGIKNRPRPVRHEGKKYYPLVDGRFATAWGRVVRDPALVAALEAKRDQAASTSTVD